MTAFLWVTGLLLTAWFAAWLVHDESLRHEQDWHAGDEWPFDVEEEGI